MAEGFTAPVDCALPASLASRPGIARCALVSERPPIDCDRPRPRKGRSSQVTQGPNTDQSELLSGVIEHVIFHNVDNGFCVLRVRPRGQRELQSVVGRAPSVNPGEWITAKGKWVVDRSHGRQFDASDITTSEPTSHEGIEKYLGSGAIQGIGAEYAKRLVAKFGDGVFTVIEHEPERLREVPGIGPVRAERITSAWDEQKVVREVMIFLHSHGVGTARASRIYKTYGNDAVRVMSENPYRLARDIRGIGFASADNIAGKLGIDPTAPVRIRAGLSHVLSEAAGEGHCGLPRDDLLRAAQQLLDVPAHLAEDALRSEVAEGAVVEDTVAGRPCVFLIRLYRSERGIARALDALVRGQPPWPPIDPEKALPWIQRRLGIKLARSQAEAVRMAIREKAMVITGGPGVGKTTIVNAILRILAAKGVQIGLCAPTGRAAKRLSEAAGMEAKTIHRLLEFDPVRHKFRRGPDNPLDLALLVVDEASMVDVPLMRALMRALPAESALLVVGDVDQLPSVGPGRVLGDLIDSGAVPVARLVEVFRQAVRSQIVVNAHRINEGLLPDMGRPEGESDFYFVRASDPGAAIRQILRLVQKHIPNRFNLDPVRDIQVLCPMNRGDIGAKALNLKLQSALNPAAPERVERLGWSFARGDKVMQIENDYDKEVYNGDIGFIDAIDQEQGVLEVSFDGRRVEYTVRELDSLVPAYATTIHKSQGSEYPSVVLLVMKKHFVMLERNLIYTGITRGKRLVVLVGQRSAVRRAVETVSRSIRCTKLGEWLRDVAARRSGSAPLLSRARVGSGSY